MQQSPRFLVVLIFLLAAAVPVLGQSADHLTVATYNVENMFDVFDNPYKEDEKTPPKSREQIEQIAKAIRAMNADVVCFEELENEGLLQAMVDDFLADMGYQYVAVIPTNDFRGINLGIISRRPIVAMTSHRFVDLKLDDEPGTRRFARDLAKFTIQATDTQRIDVYVVHLKSRHDSAGDSKSARWRLAEALGARRIIAETLKADPKAPIIVMGDFNDTPGAPAISHLLSRDAADGLALIDVHAGLPADQRFTFRRSPYREEGPIDYILASPALAERAVPGSAKVFSDESALGGSDHQPVMATFDLSRAE